MDRQDNQDPQFVIRNRAIRTDVAGLVSLTDIWTVARGSPSQKPGNWWALPSSKKLAKALQDRITGKSYKSANLPAKSIYYGRGAAGTFAHPILACAYAGYLHPALEVEVREVWLRYRGGDASLADEILSRASPEANEWAATRAHGRVVRNRYTETLSRHGVTHGYGACTNEIYLALFDASAKQLKSKKGVATSLRDAMDTAELTYVMASESLSTERITELNSQGANQCQIATKKSASFIREAIEKDRADRRRAL